MPEGLTFPDCIRVVPGSWDYPWMTSLQQLSQENILNHVSRVVVECDPWTVEGRVGSPYDTFRHCLGHPYLAEIFRILHRAPQLHHLELNLEQSVGDQMKVPWDWFGSTQYAIEIFVKDWQVRSSLKMNASSAPSGRLVIRFILDFPFSILRSLHRLHVESSTLVVTRNPPNATGFPFPSHHSFSARSLVLYNASSTAAFFCGNTSLDTACIKKLRMTVANRAELEVGFSLLTRVSSYVTKLRLSFRGYRGDPPVWVGYEIYLPALEDLLIEFKRECMTRYAYPFLHMLQQHVIPLERLRLAADGPSFPDLSSKWTPLEGSKWNLFQALIGDGNVFPSLRNISIELASPRGGGTGKPVISNKMKATKAGLMDVRGIAVDFRTFMYD